MSRNSIRSIALTGALSLLVAGASAQYLDNNTGAALGGGDDSTYSYTLGGSFSFYGTSYSTVGVCTNGFLSVTGAQTYNGYSNTTFPTTNGANIAPFWDDLWVFNTGYYMTGYSNSNYDAFTWNVEHIAGNNGSLIQAQAILFRNGMNLDGFNFLAGDIAFSYGTVTGGSAGNSATVGVNAADGSNSTLGPGTANGTETGSNLPVFANTGQFFLFRWDSGRQSYAGSIQAVPEPASMAVLGLGALAFIRRRRKA